MKCGREVSHSRKEGKRKHLSRRAEAIRNACWVSKTEKTEEKDKNQIKGREERGGSERALLFCERTRPKLSTVPGSTQTRQSKWNHLMKKSKRKQMGGGRGTPCKEGYEVVWRSWEEEKASFCFPFLHRQPYLRTGHRFTKIIKAPSNMMSRGRRSAKGRERKTERQRSIHFTC